MNKMNKKGFTLIEMLVVIAIIAVLVSIIIPTVSSATGKAQAATDAANLRSMLAEATIDYLNGQTETAGMVKYTAPTAGATGAAKYGTFALNTSAPECKTDKTWTGKITFDDAGNITAAFVTGTGDGAKTYELKHFAYVAENGGSLDEAVTALAGNVNPAPGQGGGNQGGNQGGEGGENPAA